MMSPTTTTRLALHLLDEMQHAVAGERRRRLSHRSTPRRLRPSVACSRPSKRLTVRPSIVIGVHDVMHPRVGGGDRAAPAAPLHAHRRAPGALDDPDEDLGNLRPPPRRVAGNGRSMSPSPCRSRVSSGVNSHRVPRGMLTVTVAWSLSSKLRPMPDAADRSSSRTGRGCGTPGWRPGCTSARHPSVRRAARWPPA